jgi:hypothetical protein
MVSPFIHRIVQHRDTTDGDLTDVIRQGCACPDGAQEAVPAVGDGGRVKERAVEGEEWTGRPTSRYASVDGGGLGVHVGGRVGDVGKTHPEREKGVAYMAEVFETLRSGIGSFEGTGLHVYGKRSDWETKYL